MNKLVHKLILVQFPIISLLDYRHGLLTRLPVHSLPCFPDLPTCTGLHPSQLCTPCFLPQCIQGSIRPEIWDVTFTTDTFPTFWNLATNAKEVLRRFLSNYKIQKCPSSLNRLQFFLGVSPPKPTLSRNKIFIFVFRPEGCKRREHTESVRICGGRGKSSDRRNKRLVRPLRRLEEQRSGKLSPVISACHSRQDVLKLSPSNC